MGYRSSADEFGRSPKDGRKSLIIAIPGISTQAYIPYVLLLRFFPMISIDLRVEDVYRRRGRAG